MDPVEEDDFDQLQCGFCYNALTEPRLLSCDHAYCTLCLDDASKTQARATGTAGAICCPRCGLTTRLDMWGVLSLQKSEHLSEMIRMLKSRNAQFNFKKQRPAPAAPPYEEEQYGGYPDVHDDGACENGTSHGDDGSSGCDGAGWQGAHGNDATWRGSNGDCHGGGAGWHGQHADGASEDGVYREEDWNILPREDEAPPPPERHHQQPQQDGGAQASWWVKLIGQEKQKEKLAEIEERRRMETEDARMAAQLQQQFNYEAERNRVQAHAQPSAPPLPPSHAPSNGYPAPSAPPAPSYPVVPHAASAPPAPDSSSGGDASVQGWMTWIGSSVQKALSSVSETVAGPALQPGEPAFAPFEVTGDRASRLMEAWMTGRWFTPSGFVESVHIGPMLPKFVPFWHYSVNAVVELDGEVSCPNPPGAGPGTFVQRVRQTYIHYYKDEMEIASSYPQYRKQLEGVTDWRPAAATLPVSRMPPAALATLDSPSSWITHWKDFMHRVYKEQQAKGRDFVAKSGKRVIKSDVHIQFQNLEKRLIYLPVFLTNYSYSNTLYPTIVHGTSGEVVADRPYGLGAVTRLFGY